MAEIYEMNLEALNVEDRKRVISDRHSIAQTPTSKQLFAHQHRQKLRRLFRDSVACQTQRERNKVYYQKTLTPPEAK